MAVGGANSRDVTRARQSRDSHMGVEQAAPCRHRGAPPEAVVTQVVRIIQTISEDNAYLNSRGLSPEEFRLALPVAIEQMRGRSSASNKERRDFLALVLDHLVAAGAIAGYAPPRHGSDTVYRLAVPDIGDVAIVQKGCPDGKHSSVAWSVPDWAAETYLWWLCPSLKNDPGWHVSAGVKRLRREFFSLRPDELDGVIFHNRTCGTDQRPCPKMRQAVRIGDADVPPPCVWVLPKRADRPDYNWDGTRTPRFPSVLLSAFGLESPQTPLYTGYVGFRESPGAHRTTITSRFGPGKTTTFRSSQ